jgi:Ni/Co efflux regulator RcnB
MYRGYRLLSSILLTAALAAPVAMMAAASAQDDRKQDDKQGENKRYYDKSHKDYHNWDSKEDGAYQRYQTEHHEKRGFAELNSRQQGAYWSWRHNNPDHEQSDHEHSDNR